MRTPTYERNYTTKQKNYLQIFNIFYKYSIALFIKMDRLSVHSESCSIWNNSQLEKTGLYEKGCIACASESSLSIIKTLSIWRWDISIPANWRFGDWSKVSLFSTQVNVYIVQCRICKTIYKVYPSFVLKGTSLTLFALFLTAYVYQTTELTWRDIPIEFCHGSEIISHSTLYKAVHGLAYSLSLHKPVISKGIQALPDKYQSYSKDDPQIPMKQKSILLHTQARELLIMAFLLNIRSYDSTDHDFFRSFHMYIKKAGMILSNVDPPVTALYCHKFQPQKKVKQKICAKSDNIFLQDNKSRSSGIKV